MKKILSAVVALLILGIVCIYIFIPKHLVVSHVAFVRTTDYWTFKFLSEKENWAKWWPGELVNEKTGDKRPNTSFRYQEQIFSLDTLYYNALKVKIKNADDVIDSKINIISIRPDSIGIYWSLNIPGSMNPFKRLTQYMNAVEIKKNMTAILQTFKSFLDKPDNIYGMHIEFGKIRDTLLLSTKATFDSFPQTAEIYDLFGKLNTYIKTKGAVQDGLPMLNINNEEANLYTVMVALPINKTVPETNEFKLKKMVRGNTLIAEVKGGPYTIEKAFLIMDQFKLDHARVAPAIHFQSLITDRSKESDTSKWNTRLYYPIR